MPIDISPQAVVRIRELSLKAAEESPNLFSPPIDRAKETLLEDARIFKEKPVAEMTKAEREAYYIKMYL